MSEKRLVRIKAGDVIPPGAVFRYAREEEDESRPIRNEHHGLWITRTWLTYPSIMCFYYEVEV